MRRPSRSSRTFVARSSSVAAFKLVHVMFGQETIEVSTFRALVNVDRVIDEHGRVLADNLYGEQNEDSARRDFTINALYYDPTTG